VDVTIRPLEESDARTSVAWRNDPSLWTLTRSRPDREILLADEQAWIKRVIADSSSRRFAIVADGVYVGNVYLTDVDDRTAEYHIFIGNRKYHGRGVARRASEEILRYAREILRLDAVRLEVHRQNHPAVSLYRSLGFEQTGTDGEFLQMRVILDR
jgi:RimJ/RimL family protein N-acetyltransferase